MEVCNYSTETILNDPVYFELCKCFLDACVDDEMRFSLENILYNGGCDDFTIRSKAYNRDNPRIERQRRISMAYLLTRNPETFYFLKENNINLFHGTNADALVSILENGLNSNSYSADKGIEVNTGERWSRMNELRDYISVTDILDISEGYASIMHDDNKLDFGVVLGINPVDVEDKIVRVSSDIPEAGISGYVPIEDISFIGVPSDKLDMVREVVGNNIMVLPVDDMNLKFYYENEGLYTINYDEYEKFKEKVKENETLEFNYGKNRL